MKNTKNLITIFVFLCLAAFVFQGCAMMKKVGLGPKETGEEQKAPETTGEKTGTTAEEHIVKITNFKDGTTGIDIRMPVEWWIDPKAGKVNMMGINIFECDTSGKEKSGAIAALKTLSDPNLLETRKWTFFEKDVDKHWLFSGSHQGLTELKAKTKYLMTFMASCENRTETIRIYFTTK